MRLLKQIRRREALYRVTALRLRHAGIAFTKRADSWGYNITGITNQRTGSEWHSVEECAALLREKSG